jgi:serine/threonine protein kinase/tetratricopeptide (TPR) repeat protein
MQAGLDDQDEEHAESLESILTKIDIRDSDWRIGHYQILEEIGRGGMGVIYRARQQHSGRIVALKRVLSFHSDSPETLARFRREAEAASLLDHPNILPIYEVGESEDGLPFFAMKFAPGGSLKEVGPALNHAPGQIVPLMVSVARAVQSAHAQGLLHRDLKPGNILLDGRGEPLVSDFGLAKWLDANNDLTRTMTIFGTPGYIAPEQTHGPTTRSGPASDIYSLGAILFDLLAGRPPFLGEHALAVVSQAVEKPAPPLRSLVPSIDRDLETICARCLDRDPAARYSSADALADDLERWIQGKAILARPISPPARVWRWSRRNRRLAASLSVCALLAAMVLLRQNQTNRLQNTIRSDAAAAHSIAVLPFLDLDQILPDAGLSAQVAASLQHAMSINGPSRVELVKEPPRRWTGTLLQDEIEETSRKAHSRAVLTGTRRYVDGKMHVSLHLIRENGTDVLGNWLIDANAADPIWSLQEVPDLAGLIYKLLDQKTDSPTAEDPVMSNERARKFFLAGRDFMERRTIAELDRAISCFENAIQEEPRSISARSFLAMALKGQDSLSARPELMQRALKVAQETVALAPQDPTAHRALSGVYASNELFREALEHGFQSIELGDRSERAIGQTAFAWKMLGRPDRAIPWYLKAKLSQRQPADYDALLGDCWADLERDDKAQHEYESAGAFHPDQPDGWMGLCRLKLLAGDSEGARKIYQARLPHYSGFPPAKQLAAMVEFFSRNFVEARRLYLELANDNPLGGGNGDVYGAIDYRSAIGCLEIEAGHSVQGESLLRQAVASEKSRLVTAPRNAIAYYRLAAAQATLGETDSCLQNLRAAIDAGWIDYRSTRLDPRFDHVSGTAQFQEIISDLAAHVAKLGRLLPAASAALIEK